MGTQKGKNSDADRSVLVDGETYLALNQEQAKRKQIKPLDRHPIKSIIKEHLFSKNVLPR